MVDSIRKESPGVTEPPRRKTCSNCWVGTQAEGGPHGWLDCDNCGQPGPKPDDYTWHGEHVTHYVNHQNQWTSASDGRPAPDPSADDLLKAIHAALQARDFPAVVSLLHLLAVKDPASAEAILATVNALSRPEGVA